MEKKFKNQENEDPNEAVEGVSKPRILSSGPGIEDKYQIEKEIDKNQKVKDNRDLLTVKRENFLNIYKEQKQD